MAVLPPQPVLRTPLPFVPLHRPTTQQQAWLQRPPAQVISPWACVRVTYCPSLYPPVFCPFACAEFIPLTPFCFPSPLPPFHHQAAQLASQSPVRAATALPTIGGGCKYSGQQVLRLGGESDLQPQWGHHGGQGRPELLVSAPSPTLCGACSATPPAPFAHVATLCPTTAGSFTLSLTGIIPPRPPLVCALLFRDFGFGELTGSIPSELGKLAPYLSGYLWVMGVVQEGLPRQCVYVCWDQPAVCSRW